jgi:hypothetical protein
MDQFWFYNIPSRIKGDIMAHYAKVINGIVEQVIVAEQDVIDSGLFGDPSIWVQTSYNGNIRKNFASVGGRYDKLRDAFIPIKPFSSWILDNETCLWKAPVDYPTDGKIYLWDDINNGWYQVDDDFLPIKN